MGQGQTSGCSRSALRVVQLRVLNSFEVVVAGGTLTLPHSAQRLLGFLAVCGRHQRREAVSRRLWPDKTQRDAATSLRNAIWRIKRRSAQVICTDDYSVCLPDTVGVDLDMVMHQARQLIAGQLPPSCRDGFSDLLAHDLLPDWDDAWVYGQRERVRQLRLHALDTLCVQLFHQQRYPEAVMAAHEALLSDPLRESTHEALIATYLAAGNRCDAVRQFERYAQLMREELNVQPSERITRLIAAMRCPGSVTEPRA